MTGDHGQRGGIDSRPVASREAVGTCVRFVGPGQLRRAHRWVCRSQPEVLVGPREQAERLLVRHSLTVELTEHAVRPLRRAASQQRQGLELSKPRAARAKLDGLLQDVAGEQRLAELERTLADLLVHVLARSGELAGAPQSGETRWAER